MEQNQNDNTNNAAMGNTFRCHINSNKKNDTEE